MLLSTQNIMAENSVEYTLTLDFGGVYESSGNRGQPAQRAGIDGCSDAKSAGAEIETMYLADRDPQPCVHCGGGCFGNAVCKIEADATKYYVAFGNIVA